MQQTYNSDNPLITLSESHRKLSFRALEFILVAWVISMVISGKDLIYIGEMQYVMAIDLICLAIGNHLYRRASRQYQECETRDEKSAQAAYAHAKTLQYNIFSGAIYANCVALICCQAQWITFAAFVIWMVLFLQLPKQTDIDKNFAYGKEESDSEFI